MMRLRDGLAMRGLDPACVMAIRNVLHPDDMSQDFRSIADVRDAGVLPMYDRMQDGPRIKDDTDVLSFVAMDGRRAMLTGFRRFRLRPAGNVPGDIVYDYDGAHLLHSFIVRAAQPTFYDAHDRDGLADLVNVLVIVWPQAVQDIVCADDPRLVIASGANAATSNAAATIV
jgi:hypothetical protein